MENYYSLLGVAPDASAEEIQTAYQRQRIRYSPERVGEMGDEFAKVATERLAAIDRAYATLADPVERAAYDQRQRGAAAPRQRSAISRRELAMLIGGAVAGLLLIITVWTFAGRSTTPTISMVKLDRSAPQFELRDINGSNVSLADYAGKNVVLVNFWYSKCVPCEEETPDLQQAYQNLAPEGLVVIGINVRSNEQDGLAGEEDVRKFVERYGVTYPIVYDDNGAVGRSYQVLPLPSSFFIDTNGTIRYASYTTVTAEDVERVFNELQRGATAAR